MIQPQNLSKTSKIKLPQNPNLIFILIICLVGMIIYSNSLNNEFHFDTKPHLVDTISKKIQTPRNISELVKYTLTRSFGFFTFVVNYYFHKLEVFGYHFTNLIIHLLTSILVFWFIFLTLSSPVLKDQDISKNREWVSFLCALLFVSHPIQTQAVTYVIQRFASLATLFYLLSLCLYAKARLIQNHEPKSRKTVLFFGLSFFSAILGMFTKQIVFTLPIMILIYEYIFFKEKKEKINWKYITPFLLLILILPIIILSQNPTIIIKPLKSYKGETINNIIYFLTQFRVITTYIRLLFFPINQQLDYDYPLSHSFLELPTILSFLFLVFILIFALQLFVKFRKYTLISFGILWFFLTLSLESSIIPIADVIFEHRLYLPMVGFCIFIVSSLFYLFWDRWNKIVVSVFFLLTVIYSVLTIHRNSIWKTEETLWNDEIKKAPNNPRAYAHRGIYYRDTGNLGKAFDDYTQAIKIYPEFAEYYNLRSYIYFSQKNPDGCIADLNKAIELEPDEAFPIANRGVCYQMKKMINQALLDYDRALKINPDTVVAYANRFQIYMNKKQYDKAWDDVEKAQKLGWKVDPKKLELLRKLSGRKE